MGTRTEVTHCLNPLPYNQNISFIVKEINYIKSLLNSISNATGTVTSVGISSPDMNVTNTPITSSGIINIVLKNINNNSGIFGNQYAIPSLAVNGKGLITAIEEINIPEANEFTKGLLTFQDWNTFNNKQNALNGVGLVKSNNGTISYINDNSVSWNTAFNDSIVSLNVTGTTTKTLTLNQQDGGTLTTSWTDFDSAPVTSVFGRTGDIIAQSGDYTTTLITEGTNLYFTNARAIASTLTGYVSGAGTITSSDSILTAIQKLNGNISDLSGIYFPLQGGTLTGTGGNGFIGFNSQSSTPSTPSSGFRLYANSSNALSWIGANGFTRTFDGTSNTANRTYTLQNFDGVVALQSAANFTSGSIPFYNSTGQLAQDNANFFLDNANKRIGIRTNTPTETFEIGSGGRSIMGRSLNGNSSTYSVLYNESNGYVGFQQRGSTQADGGTGLLGMSEITAFQTTALNIVTQNGTNNSIIFSPNSVEAARFTGSTRNLLIGTTTDSGFRLDVAGTARVHSNSANQFTISNPNFINGRIRINVPDNHSFSILDVDGYGIASSSGSGFQLNSRSTNFTIWTQASNTLNLRIGGQDINPTIARTRTAIQPVPSATTLFSPTSGTAIDYSFENTGNAVFSPTSGVASYTQLQLRPSINATGTYSGIVRGLFYNPILTSITGVTHRAIETVSGDVIFGSTSGSVAIGTTTINPRSRLTVDSTTQGFLPPRMTTAQRIAISVVSGDAGLMVYDTDLACPCFYDGTAWRKISHSAA